MRGANRTPLFSAFVSVAATTSALWVLSAINATELTSTPVGTIARAEEARDAPELLHEYIEVVEGCGPSYGGKCVKARAGPGEEYALVSRLRKGVVLRVEPVVENLRVWYKIIFDEPLRYPERLAGAQYVAGGDVRHFYDDGIRELSSAEKPLTTKRIVVDRSEQKLSAYDGDVLFLESDISTGLDITPTPRGTFSVYKKTPTRYMQGPLPGVSDQYYDLPGVPWNLYFTPEGGVIHGAYWHDGFGRPWSHGCVNMPLAEARKLYEWAEIGTPVLVRD